MDLTNVMIMVLAVIAIIVISLTVFPAIVKVALIATTAVITYELLDFEQKFSDGAKMAFAPISGKALQAAVAEEKTDLLAQDDVMAEFENKSTIYPMFSFTRGLAFPDTEAVIPFTAQDFDDRSTLKQKHIGNKNRDAIAGATSATANVFNRYIRGELDENEARVWYSSEANMSSDFFPAF